MPQVTDLNVAPYYDDFGENDNFHRVLFRPGFAIQARELTTLQSILQGQIEQFGRHMFQEGSVVIPGQVTYSSSVNTLQLENTFARETIIPSQYYNPDNPVIITGSTSGMQARVITYHDATDFSQPILVIQYLNSGSDNETRSFVDGENIFANVVITHTTAYAEQIASATTFNTRAARTGSMVNLQEGVYFVRGQFVKVVPQFLLLSAERNDVSARVGFTIFETLVTPEDDASLTDNSQGSNNYAAKGAHRLRIQLQLSARTIDSTDDTNFIEIMTLKRGNRWIGHL